MNQPANSVDLFALARLSPISSLQEDQINELAAQTFEVAIPSGRELLKSGDDDTDLVYLIEGEVEIQPDGDTPYTVKSGTPAARQPLAEHSPRRGTVIAKSPVLYIRVDRDLVDTMLTWAESASSDTEEVIMCGDEILTIDTGALKMKMQHSPNFRKLPAANIDQLLEKMEPMSVNSGEVIIRQGDEGDFFYVIEKGEAIVTRVVDEEENTEDSIEMAHLSEGSAFGEAALISDKPRNATVSMQTDGVLLRLNKQDFLTLMQEPMQNWLSLEDAKQKVTEGAQWVDVRAPSEFSYGSLPAAINIPLNEAHRQSQSLSKDTLYICYCQTGRRSSAAAFIMSQYGLDVAVVKDGVKNIGAEELATN